MIDCPARDWLANLIERFLAHEFDPDTNTRLPENIHRKSQDPIIEEGHEELAHACSALEQMNAWGTAPLLTNTQDDQRRMRVLLIFLRSDTQYVPSTSKWPGYMFWPILLSIALLIAGISQFWPGSGNFLTTAFMSLICLFIGLLAIIYFITILGFAWARWFSAPKLQSDQQDHWPFKSFEALQAERARQAATSHPDPPHAL